MKKILSIAIVLMATISANAQETGIYEQKRIIEADSIRASTLYVRALEALSDWAGSLQKSKANVDVQDKDEGLVIYKGQLYLGYGKKNVAYGYDTYANYTMKVKCRDGRALITINIPNVRFHWTANNSEDHIYPIGDVYPEFKDNVNKVFKKSCSEVVLILPDAVEEIIKTIENNIKKPVDDF